MKEILAACVPFSRNEKGCRFDLEKLDRYSERYMYNNLFFGLLLLLLSLVAGALRLEALVLPLITASAPFSILAGLALGFRYDNIL